MQELELFAVTMVTYVISDQAIGAVVPHRTPATIQGGHLRLEERTGKTTWMTPDEWTVIEDMLG